MGRIEDFVEEKLGIPSPVAWTIAFVILFIAACLDLSHYIKL